MGLLGNAINVPIFAKTKLDSSKLDFPKGQLMQSELDEKVSLALAKYNNNPSIIIIK